MESVLTQHNSAQVFETVMESGMTCSPVKTLVSSTPASSKGLQPRQRKRKSSLTITVNKTEDILVAAVSALDQLTGQQHLYSVTKGEEEEDPTSKRRRQQLKGKKVLFICCGPDGLDSKKFAFELVKELGVRIFLLEDGRNGLAVAMEKSRIVEQLIRMDMTPRQSLLDDAMAALMSVSDHIGGFDGSCTFWDDAVALCARVAERLKLPGSSVRSVDTAHDKHLTREAMVKAGIPTPGNYLVKRESDLDVAAKVVGVPAILKPMYGGSSLGVLKVEKLDSLKSAYHHVLHMLRHFYEQGELMGLTFNENEAGPTFEESSLSWLVMEEFVDGDEVDVDLVLKDGEVIYQCVVDDWPQIEPWFAEMGNNCPSTLPSSVQQELASMAIETTTRAMKFRNGVFHCELKYSSKGPRIIEVNPRMGGGPVWALHKLAFGLDLVEETLYSALDIKGAPKIPEAPKRYVSCGEKFFEDSMVVPKAFCRVVEAMRLFPNVIEALPLVEAGEKIVGIRDGFPTRTARFIAYGENPDEVEAYTRKLLDMCDIPQVISCQGIQGKKSVGI